MSSPASGASHYAKGSAANILRSVLVVGAIVAVIFFAVARTNSVTPQQIDVPVAAEGHATQSGEPLSYPVDLPEGWQATSVRYIRSTGDVMMWHAGYTTPDGQYVAIQQAVDGPEEWVNVQTNNGARIGTVTSEDGREWVQREREGKVQRSLVNDPEGKGELTTIITGTGTFDQLMEFANHLRQADPTPSSASPTSS